VKNERKIFSSESDDEISKNGLIGLNKVLPTVKQYKYDFILSSPLKRAFQTSEYLNSELQIKIIQKDALKERFLGLYDNISIDQLIKYRKEKGHSFIDPTQDWYGINEIESDESIFQRVLFLLQSIKFESVLCITHAGVIKSFLYGALKIPYSVPNCFKIKNSSFTRIHTDDFTIFQLHELQNIS